MTVLASLETEHRIIKIIGLLRSPSGNTYGGLTFQLQMAKLLNTSPAEGIFISSHPSQSISNECRG